MNISSRARAWRSLARCFAGQPAARAADILSAPAAYDWSGVYVGGDIGWLRSGGHWELGRPGETFAGPEHYSGDGVTGALHLGYNWQVNSPLVIGVETDWGLSNAKASSQSGFIATATSRWQGSIRARAGVAFDQVLLYGTAGVGVAKFDYSLSDIATTASFSKTRTGLVFGAGLEYALAKGWSARAEYLHADYGQAIGTGAPVFIPIVEQRHALHTDAVDLGFSYKFN